jgi:hypothetical protein
MYSWELAIPEPPADEEAIDQTGPIAPTWEDGDFGESQAFTSEPEGSTPSSIWGAGESDEPASSGRPDEVTEDASGSDGDESSQPAEWGPTLLEPKSADWLVEQSEPVDSGPGVIVQPEAWGSFASGGDDAAAADLEMDDEAGPEEDEDHRAWGT